MAILGTMPPVGVTGSSNTGSSFLGSVGNVIQTIGQAAGTVKAVADTVRSVTSKPGTLTYSTSESGQPQLNVNVLGLSSGTWKIVAIGALAVVGVWLWRKQ